MEKTKYEEGSLEYKIEKVYTSFFNIKKFKKLIDESQKKEIIEYLRFYTTGGCLGVGIGWSRENQLILINAEYTLIMMKVIYINFPKWQIC